MLQAVLDVIRGPKRLFYPRPMYQGVAFHEDNMERCYALLTNPRLVWWNLGAERTIVQMTKWANQNGYVAERFLQWIMDPPRHEYLRAEEVRRRVKVLCNRFGFWGELIRILEILDGSVPEQVIRMAALKERRPAVRVELYCRLNDLDGAQAALAEIPKFLHPIPWPARYWGQEFKNPAYAEATRRISALQKQAA